MNIKRRAHISIIAIALIAVFAFAQPALACRVYVDGYVTYCGCTPAEGLIVKIYRIPSVTPDPEQLKGSAVTDSNGYYRIDFELPWWWEYYRIELWSSDGNTLLNSTTILWREGTYYRIDFKLPGICEEFEGLTPGFWKNHLDAWEGYTPSALLNTVFTNDAIGVNLGQYTLLQALQFPGGAGVAGAERILLRAAVAALLNAAASEINYPLTTAEVISQVNNALASNNRATILELASQLDGYNNLGTL